MFRAGLLLVPFRSCQQPVNIHIMFNSLTLRKNLLHFLKYFYYLIPFNIIWGKAMANYP